MPLRNDGGGADHALLIAGAEVTTGNWLDHVSACDGRPLGRVALGGAAEVERAIVAAEGARRACSQITTGHRAEILWAIADGIAARRDLLSQLIVEEVAKPVDLARIEVDRAIATFKDAAHVAATNHGEIVPLDVRPGLENREALVRRVPLGPVTAITPFNFPLNLVAHKVAPALAAGCPVILKPAPAAPLTALELARIIHSAGWPQPGLQVLALEADLFAAPLVSDPRMRVLSFTGSAAVGWALRDAAHGKPVALELGGDATTIVHADADVQRAADRCAFGAFAYAGQVCIKVQHILVDRSIADRFREAFLAATARIVPGDPRQLGVVMGPVLRDRDADRIESWISEARAQGANLLAGGGRNGRVIEPTVIEGVTDGAKLGCEEVFGPAVTLDTYDALGAAVGRINRSRYGLQASVFTRDATVIRQLFRDLDVGALIVDEATTLRVDSMPYGGTKASGLGREGVRWALDLFTERRTLVW